MARGDRLTYAGLALAMVASAAVLLWTSRGFFFLADELQWVATAPPNYDLGALLKPHITHPMLVTRLI